MEENVKNRSSESAKELKYKVLTYDKHLQKFVGTMV